MDPVYQEKTTKDGLKVVTCIIMYRPKGIECHGGPGFTKAIGIGPEYRKAVGIAVCDPHDTYDPEFGKKLARSRAKDAAYTSFYSAVKEVREKFNLVLINLEKNLYAKAEMVRTRNRNYRKKLAKAEAEKVKEAVTKTIRKPRAKKTTATPTPAVETKTKSVEVKVRVRKPAVKKVDVKAETTRKPRTPRAKKVTETTK